MHIKVKDHLVELEAEDHHPDNRGGLIIALGILLLVSAFPLRCLR